ncbi:MAG: hypothetical protein CR971_01875 [candidate division SR1 bacterium]|nr:MAG: hypothetical protein CR971_01875 [candidate division SR1 bacterium]
MEKNIKKKVAFLGPEGSYTHQVVKNHFDSINFLYLSLNSIEDVFKTLNNKEADFGVVPSENEIVGPIKITHDCLDKYNLNIVTEIDMNIHHCFVSKVKNIENIKSIYSHPSAYEQCKRFLDKNLFSGLNFVPTTSTSIAAKMSLKDKNSAAICSHVAAKIYNIPIMFKNIEDSSFNRTTFLVLSNFNYISI